MDFALTSIGINDEDKKNVQDTVQFIDKPIEKVVKIDKVLDAMGLDDIKRHVIKSEKYTYLFLDTDKAIIPVPNNNSYFTWEFNFGHPIDSLGVVNIPHEIRNVTAIEIEDITFADWPTVRWNGNANNLAFLPELTKFPLFNQFRYNQRIYMQIKEIGQSFISEVPFHFIFQRKQNKYNDAFVEELVSISRPTFTPLHKRYTFNKPITYVDRFSLSFDTDFGQTKFKAGAFSIPNTFVAIVLLAPVDPLSDLPTPPTMQVRLSPFDNVTLSGFDFGDEKVNKKINQTFTPAVMDMTNPFYTDDAWVMIIPGLITPYNGLVNGYGTISNGVKIRMRLISEE